MTSHTDPSGRSAPLPELPSLYPSDPLAAWVFGYGSLIWNPGFPVAETGVGRLYGYHRALCLWSWHYRGTRERPGLVMGLDRGGSCRGLAFRIASDSIREALEYLRERELDSHAYDPLVKPVRLDDSRVVQALTFVVKRGHPQYAGRLSPERVCRTVAGASGQRGANVDYVLRTARALDALGVRCSVTSAVAGRLAPEAVLDASHWAARHQEKTPSKA